MSAQFWFKLLLALLIFLIALLFVNRSKFHVIQRLRASRLRSQLIPKMQAILPIISVSLNAEKVDLFPLFKLRADLEDMVLKANVLFDVEYLGLIDFLTKLSQQIGEFESNTEALGNFSKDQEGIDDLILCGQRVIKELTELA